MQLALSGKDLSEQQLNDYGLNFIRTQLITIPGTSVPAPYGGKLVRCRSTSTRRHSNPKDFLLWM